MKATELLVVDVVESYSIRYGLCGLDASASRQESGIEGFGVLQEIAIDNLEQCNFYLALHSQGRRVCTLNPGPLGPNP